MAMERSNLLSMMKLSVKVLIQSALSLGRSLDSEHPPLQQFLIVLEHCLKHGLKGGHNNKPHTRCWVFLHRYSLSLCVTMEVLTADQTLTKHNVFTIAMEAFCS